MIPDTRCPSFWDPPSPLQLGRYISSKGGVVTAEEMAPFLVPADGSLDELPEDESYVLPALVRFGGDPEVGADGQILYRFPSMQVTAAGGGADEGDGGWRFSDWVGGGSRRQQQQQTAEVPLEQPVPFTAASRSALEQPLCPPPPSLSLCSYYSYTPLPTLLASSPRSTRIHNNPLQP